MSKGFSKLDPQSHKGKTDVWLTPTWIFQKLGDFDLDPCAFPNHATAKQHYFEKGLERTWIGRIWLNPPYSEVSTWLNRLAEHNSGIALVFARTDTRWAQKHFALADSVFFLKGRVKFLTSSFVESTNAGHGSMLLAYGENPDWPFDGWKAK